MKKYGSFIVLTLLLCGSGIYLFIGAINDLKVKREGTIVEAVVEKLPPFCLPKHNKMGLSYAGKSYILPLNREYCRKGYYRIGQVVQCYWDQKREELYHMDISPEFDIFISIVFFFAPFVMWYKYRNTVELHPKPWLIKRGRNAPKSEVDKELKKKK